MSLNLQPGALKLPFADGTVYSITSLFDDPRRGSEGWDPKQRGLLPHEGIDWACPKDTPIYPMFSGKVINIFNTATIIDPNSSKEKQEKDKKIAKDENFGYGNAVTVESVSGDTVFTLTYAHLHTVIAKVGDTVSSFKSNLDEGETNIALGTSGSTGNSTGNHLHVHLILDDNAESPDGFSKPYLNFQQYLPEGHYHWPDIEALRSIINDSGLISKIDDPDRNEEIKDPDLINKNRDLLGEQIDQWMDSHLRGWNPNGARLWVKPGGKVYRFPKVDANCEYPGRPTPGVAIVGRGNVVSDPRHADTDAPRPDWWRIMGNSFPACWVRDEDTEVVGNWEDVPVVSSSLPEAPPRYLQKYSGHASVNVRSGPNTHTDKRDEDGNLVAATNTVGRIANDKWVPIVDLKSDATTNDYLWYQIPYDTSDASKRGWVRGDVVTAKSALLLEEKKKNVFPTTIPVGFPSCAVPCVVTAKGKTVPAYLYPYPDEESRDPDTLAYAFEGVASIEGCSENSPLWYQLQLTDTHRGWVRASQVTAHNIQDLHKVKPRLRSGVAAAIPVRKDPAAAGTVLATIGAGDTGWHALRGRDAAYPGWWRIRYAGPVAGWVRSDQVRTHGSLAGLAATWDPALQLSLRASTIYDVRVRSGPERGHGQVGFIAGGSTDRYDILGKDATTATWYQIRYSPTVVGWVHRDHVQTHGSLSGLAVTSVPQLSLKATTTDGLRVRSGPGTIHSQVGSIAGGSTAQYDILGQDAATAAWYQIRFSATVTGWVHKDYIRTHGDLTGLRVTSVPQLSLKATTTLGLNVRSGPGTAHAKVGFIPGGSAKKYNILGKDAATAVWYRIRFSSSVVGWVHKDYVRTHGSLAGVPVAWVAGPQLSLKSTTTYNLNVRSGPGTSHAKVGFIPGGSAKRYDILARNATAPTWYQIRFSASVTGWVHANYVQTHGSLVGLAVR